MTIPELIICFARIKRSRLLFYLLLTWITVVLSVGCSHDSKKDGPLLALVGKVREQRETTKIGGDVAVTLGLGDKEQLIPAHGQVVIDEQTKQDRAILVTETNDVVLIFGDGSVAYFCLTDLSGKLRKVFKAELGNQESYPAVADVQPMFEEQVAFWKAYLGAAESQNSVTNGKQAG